MSDERCCEGCGHLRVEHKLHGIAGLPETTGRGWCFCCDCPQFSPEPGDSDDETFASLIAPSSLARLTKGES